MKRCPACGAASADAARFCSECGAPLPAAAAPAEERKVVTVLFADLVDFTSRAERMDVEDVRALLVPYYERLRRELERFGGTVEKFIGDAVMAVFGAPVAHEDDAERAVRAGLAIQDAVAALREQEALAGLHVRVGINTGEALVALGGDGTHGASGDTVNTAARLQSAAPRDGVLVGQRTYEATSRAIVYAPAPPVDAKGKSVPLTVWVAERPRSTIAERPVDTAAPLVGRDRQLAVLAGALAQACGDRAAQLVTVLGAPGLGKSRLVAELAEVADREPGLIRWRQGRSLPYGDGVGFWPVGEMVKAEAGILDSDSAEVAGAKLREVVAAVVGEADDVVWLERQLRPLVGLGGELEASAESMRAEAFAAWRAFFEALADAVPTVLVFEDLHWADDGLLDFVDLLADRARSVPLLLLCTARPELLERRPSWGGGKPNAVTIALTPLSDEDTARLVGALLEHPLLPAELQAALIGHADGNPLYAQEYVRMLQDRELLVRGERGIWALRAGAAGEQLPASVQGIIAARLDALGASEKRLVQDASVIGRVCWVGAAAAVGERPRAEVDQLLDGLERKQLLRAARRSSIAGETEFSFTHSLTQTVAYGQLPRPGRAAKHVRAGSWIDAQGAGREDRAELVAHHYKTALELLRQTGADTTGVEPLARDAFTEAGRHAEALHQHSCAARHLAAALELTPADERAHAALLLDRATALYRAGDVDEATLTAARDAQLAIEDWPAAAWGEALLTYWHMFEAGRAESADAHAERAAELAARGAPGPADGEIAHYRAYRLVVQGRNAEAVALADQVLAAAPSPGTAASMRAWRGVARASLGHADAADECREAAAALAALRDPFAIAANANLALLLRYLGDLHGAEAPLAEATRWAERFADFARLGWVELERACLDYLRGDWQAASAATDRHADSLNAANAAIARDSRCRLLAARGPLGAAVADADAVVAHARAADDLELLLAGLAGQALAHQTVDRDAAHRACDEILALLRDRGSTTNTAFHLSELAPILARAGRHEELAAAAALVANSSRWLDAVQATAGQRYDDAVDIYAAVGSVPHHAAALVLAAEDHTAHGRRHAAEVAAAGALAVYDELGAVVYAGQAAALRRATA